MPINNSYNQTPKRIFTNKPFIKGMNYTNADLEPFVCRAVANLELESSNSATKLRKGITNNILDTDQGLVYKFYKKFVIFTNLITETMYNNNITPTDVQSADLGIKVINEDKKENDIYETIITNNTKLEYTTALNNSLDLFGLTANYKIYALVSDEGRLNHVINNQDYSFMFFGAIFKNTSIQYKGPIKLYYHVTAQKIIIEVIKPQTLDVADVKTDGVNIVASNPAVYKDWINYQNGPQYYSDYFGDTRAVTEEDKNKAIIDITTVALYDAPVEPVPYNNSSNANMLVSIDKTKQDPFYIRPFYAIPNTEYGVMVTAQSKNKLDYIYNFISRSFERKPYNEVNKSDTITENINNIIISENYINPRVTLSQLDISANITIVANTQKKLFRIAATEEDISEERVISEGFGADIINDNNAYFKYRIATSYEYTLPARSICTDASINNISGDHSVDCNVISTKYLYVYSAMEEQEEVDSTYPAMPTCAYNDYDFVFTVSGNSITTNVSVPSSTYSFEINLPNSSVSEIESHLTKHINTTVEDFGIQLWYDDNLFVYFGDFDINYTESSSYNNNWGRYTYTLTTEMATRSITKTYSNNDIPNAFTSAIINLANLSSSSYKYKVALKIDNGNWETYYIDRTYLSISVTEPKSTIDISSTLIKGYSLLAKQSSTTSASLNQNIILNLNNDNSLDIVCELKDNTNFNNPFVKTAAAETIYGYTSSDLDDIMNNYSTLLLVLSTNNVTPASYPMNITTHLKYYQINKSNCHYINTNGYSIPINRNIDNIIDTSTIKVVMFPYEELDESNVYYKSDEFVEKPIYSFGTDGEEIVDYSIYKSNPLFNKSLNMTNHLGHTVVWGDYTDSNSLYYSAFNDISYFPSNYIFTFDNPIVYAYPHRDSLVVFTTDDVYMLHSGNVPSTTSTDGSEVAFTQSLIQANTRLGKQNIDTVRAIGKDLFFINNNSQGYLLKSNKYVSNVSDVYLIKLTSQIDDLLDNPYQYAKERYMKWYPNSEETSISSKLNTITKITDAAPPLDTISVPDTYEVVDGDTIKFDNQYYRLVYMDTPEVSTNERLAYTAKCILAKLMAQASNNILYDTGKIDNTEYNRKLVLLMCDNIDVSATMLYNGLAEYYDSSYTEYENNLYSSCYSFAKLNQRGIHNNNKYTELTENDNITFTEFDGSIDTYNPVWNTNSNELYCYTTNSYVYIIQAIKLSIEKAITIFYKYSIDAKVWTTYDIPTYIKPNDIIPDNNTVGFKILCNNDIRGKASLLEFKNSSQDIIQYKFTKSNDLGEYTLDADLKYNYINVYFDSGNQSISLMNDKLFREIKLLLGALPDSLLSMDYSIDFYTDGKLVIPNQAGNCNTHIHHRPINTHYKGSVENLEGFQKVTFFAPARGRIPRIVFSLTCESDINILEYAIVYMQLNAK